MDGGRLEQQVASVERGIIFLKQEHLAMLTGLQLEISHLKRRCHELSCELDSRFPDRNATEEEEELANRCEAAERLLERQQCVMVTARGELRVSQARAFALGRSLKEEERRFLEELKRRSHKITLLNQELQHQNVVTTTLHHELHVARSTKAQVLLQEERRKAEEERRGAEGRAEELELRLRGLEELILTLKDIKGAQKVTEWHRRMEEARLQELRKARELVVQKEEISYLKKLVKEQDRTISSLEEDIVQLNTLQEERQLSWDQREVELERRLEGYEKQQNEILSSTEKCDEATGSLPDPALPLAHQLEFALGKNREHIRTILDVQAACKSLDKKLKETEESLRKAEQNILSRDKVINELRLRLPDSVAREHLLADLSKHEENQRESQPALKVAHQTIKDLQARLDKKEEMLKKCQNQLVQVRQGQEEMIRRHQEELRVLHEKLDVHSDISLDRFKQTAMELMKKPTIRVQTSKHLERLAELEQTVAEQDISLSSIKEKLKLTTAALERQRSITEAQAKEHANKLEKLEERYVVQLKALTGETEDQRSQMTQMEKEMNNLRMDLEAQKEATVRSPSNTMKNLVERLKAQLAQKEKQLKALSKALLELRAEMTAAAEQQVIANAAQREESLNVQLLVDRHTKDLKAQVHELKEELQAAKDFTKSSRSRENNLKEEVEGLNQDIQRSQKTQKRLQAEKEEREQEVLELKQQVKRLTTALQIHSEAASKGPTIENLQRKIRRLESDLEKRAEVKEDPGKTKEEIVRWEESKKWQARMEKVKNSLKERERDNESLSKQLGTLRDLYARLEQEKAALQKKLKARGVAVDPVVGVRSTEMERELEDLRRKNSELETQITTLKQQQAAPCDDATENLVLRNHILEENQTPKESPSRPSTSGRGTGTPSQRDLDLSKENLRLASENLELRFQLEQTNRDLPRLKDQVSNLKEFCAALKKEKAEVEKRLVHIRGAGNSGKTVPELEKTIGLMKKVVERVQRENNTLKKSSRPPDLDRVAALEKENEQLKADFQTLKSQSEAELISKLESKTKGLEKIMVENERLRKEIKREMGAAEKMRVTKTSLEVTNEKLEAELEETKQRLREALCKPVTEGTGKAWKASVVTRMFENKMKELEKELSLKTSSLSELKLQLKEAKEREERAEMLVRQREDQVDVLKRFPALKADAGASSGVQTTTRLKSAEPDGETASSSDYRKVNTLLQAAETEKSSLQAEVRRLKKELESFDPTLLDELEDLKYNYNLEVKKNILLEEQLKKVCDQFGVQAEMPSVSIS
uniref:Centrosomal protein 290 n=1 Tax=Nothobranchius furzeri TaxID=105023 RepID=A0A1A8U840_NOTFU